ncbi:MAG: ABC transporter substrate-binding protein, partial [Anaerolineaceae bacterium]
MKKPNWLSLTLAVVMITALLLTACQPAAEATQQPAAESTQAEQTAEEAPAQEASAAPVEETSKVGGTLIYSVTAEPDVLDPAKTGAGISDLILQTVGCSLVMLDTQGNVMPYVATSWDVAEDGLTYTFHLRDDVKYHNGR